jgi:hypothetical protein
MTRNENVPEDLTDILGIDVPYKVMLDRWMPPNMAVLASENGWIVLNGSKFCVFSPDAIRDMFENACQEVFGES